MAPRLRILVGGLVLDFAIFYSDKAKSDILIHLTLYRYENGCLTPDMGSVFIALDPSLKENGCLEVSVNLFSSLFCLFVCLFVCMSSQWNSVSWAMFPGFHRYRLFFVRLSVPLFVCMSVRVCWVCWSQHQMFSGFYLPFVCLSFFQSVCQSLIHQIKSAARCLQAAIRWVEWTLSW